jgi:fructokinase
MTTMGLIAMFAASPHFTARVPPALLDDLRRLAERWEPRLIEVSHARGLVHCDFNSRNIFVARDGDVWRVTGILDWEFAINASPFVDVGNFLRYHRPEHPRFEPSFSRGLREGGLELPPDWLMIARMMDVPALCELLTRPRLPATAAAEVVDLLARTVGDESTLAHG